ncbi:hypothetical protein J5N97_024917 [Dioscorea zingiberensis]|uniref:Uncharacterized protein n=1 Tax=Dioscorea zingiberensis TaxID=325984 RepID=A0A9D5C7U8_9LILI|nr:hypothetical protein J5N97_024917 [Dioscorea zingiberensis]
MPQGERLRKLEEDKGIVMRFVIGHSATPGGVLDRAIDAEEEQHQDSQPTKPYTRDPIPIGQEAVGSIHPDWLTSRMACTSWAACSFLRELKYFTACFSASSGIASSTFEIGLSMVPETIPPRAQVQCPLEVVNLQASRDVAVLDFAYKFGTTAVITQLSFWHFQ